MYYPEWLARQISLNPPAIRGLIDGEFIRPLLSWSGEGARRVFVFDQIGELRFRDLTRRPWSVSLAEKDTDERFILPERHAWICPSCGFEMQGSEFWSHYNGFHARRPWWLNAEHWTAMGLHGTWKPPPELR